MGRVHEPDIEADIEALHANGAQAAPVTADAQHGIGRAAEARPGRYKSELVLQAVLREGDLQLKAVRFQRAL
jgi:hypothetical protein